MSDRDDCTRSRHRKLVLPMRPSRPHDPDYGKLPIYKPGLQELANAARAHFRPERLPTWTLFSAVYAIARTAVRMTSAADDRYFGGWRDQPLNAPVFIIGNPRSGTTMLHRLMSFDDETFSGMRLYQSSLPSVSVQKFIQAVAKADERTPGRPLRKAVDALNDVLFDGWDGIHKLGIDEHEEDEAAWAFGMTSITINLLVPYTEELNSMRWFDYIEPEFRARYMDWYESTIRRHLYANAPTKRFLNKNVFFVPRVRSVVERIPDARFLYLARHPYEALPSFLSMWWEKWVGHQPDIRKDGPEALALARLAFDYYEYGLELLDELSPEQIKVVRYDELTEDPYEQVHEIYDWLGIEMSEAFRARLLEFTSEQRCYTSAHTYTLEDFGLDRGSVYLSAQRFCERFGFER